MNYQFPWKIFFYFFLPSVINFFIFFQVEQVHGKFAKLQELRAASWAVEVLYLVFLLGYGTCILRGLLLLTLKIYKRASLLQFSTGCLVFMTRKCTKYGFCRISGWIENSENWILGFFLFIITAYLRFLVAGGD